MGFDAPDANANLNTNANRSRRSSRASSNGTEQKMDEADQKMDEVSKTKKTRRPKGVPAHFLQASSGGWHHQDNYGCKVQNNGRVMPKKEDDADAVPVEHPKTKFRLPKSMKIEKLLAFQPKLGTDYSKCSRQKTQKLAK